MSTMSAGTDKRKTVLHTGARALHFCFSFMVNHHIRFIVCSTLSIELGCASVSRCMSLLKRRPRCWQKVTNGLVCATAFYFSALSDCSEVSRMFSSAPSSTSQVRHIPFLFPCSSVTPVLMGVFNPSVLPAWQQEYVKRLQI